MTILEITNPQMQIPLNHQQITFVCRQGDQLIGSKESQAPASALIGMLHTRRGWVVIDYTGTETFVNNLRVADAKLVGDRDQIKFVGCQARIVAQRSEVVADGSKLLQLDVHCPYCFDSFSIGQAVTYCPSCETPHHGDCWEACVDGCARDINCGYHKSQDIPGR